MLCICTTYVINQCTWKPSEPRSRESVLNDSAVNWFLYLKPTLRAVSPAHNIMMYCVEKPIDVLRNSLINRS